MRGPSLFLGYLDDPTSTARVVRHGWLRTGDVGVADDDSRITIVDRIKDVVIVSGFNVSPSEVEDVLVAHPSVGATLVVGEADERTGERVVAFVTPSDGAPPDPERWSRTAAAAWRATRCRPGSWSAPSCPARTAARPSAHLRPRLTATSPRAAKPFVISSTEGTPKTSDKGDHMLGFIIMLLIVGAIAGFIGRLLVPGRDPIERIR